MVLAYRSYVDVAVSPQTERPRVVFEENSGLADVLPVDYIDEAIRDFLVSRKNDPSVPKN